jgi:hypothetical protein
MPETLMEFRKSYRIDQANGNSFIVQLVTDGDSVDEDDWWLIMCGPVYSVDRFMLHFSDAVEDHPLYQKSGITAISPVVIPRMNPWTKENELAAENLGWAIIWYEGDYPEIQRLGENAFDSDRAAAQWVWRMAEHGNTLCLRAIAALQACYP